MVTSVLLIPLSRKFSSPSQYPAPTQANSSSDFSHHWFCLFQNFIPIGKHNMKLLCLASFSQYNYGIYDIHPCCMYHQHPFLLLIHIPLYEYVAIFKAHSHTYIYSGCFWFWAIWNQFATNNFLNGHLLLQLLVNYLELELVGHGVVLGLTLKETVRTFPKVAILFYIFTRNAQRFWLFPILSNSLLSIF